MSSRALAIHQVKDLILILRLSKGGDSKCRNNREQNKRRKKLSFHHTLLNWTCWINRGKIGTETMIPQAKVSLQSKIYWAGGELWILEASAFAQVHSRVRSL